MLRSFPPPPFRVPRRPGCLWCNFSLFSAHSAHLQPVAPGMHICDRGRVVISPTLSRMCSSRLPMVQLFFVFGTFGTFATCFTRNAHLRPGPSCDIANMEPNVLHIATQVGMHICDRGRVVISPIWSRLCRLHCFALLCIALLCIALLCIALHCFALHYFALLCFALLCIGLHYFTVWGPRAGINFYSLKSNIL